MNIDDIADLITQRLTAARAKLKETWSIAKILESDGSMLAATIMAEYWLQHAREMAIVKMLTIVDGIVQNETAERADVFRKLCQSLGRYPENPSPSTLVQAEIENARANEAARLMADILPMFADLLTGADQAN